MYIYIINILFIFLGSLFTRKDLFSPRILKKQNIYILIALELILVVGCRDTSVGTDTLAYMDLNHYIREHIQSLPDLLNDWYVNTYLGFEKGYLIYCYLLLKLGVTEQLFILISTFISLSPIMILIYKKSSYPFLSLLFFILFGMYSYSFNVLRQFLAIGFLSVAYLLYDRKKYIASVLFVSIAVSIHSSSIIIIIFLLAKFLKRITPIKILLSYIGLVVFLILGNYIVSNILSGITKYNTSGIIGQKNYITVFVLISIFSYIVFTHKGTFDKYDKNNIILLYFYIVMQTAALFAGILARSSLYFYVGIVVGIPNIVLRKITKESVLIIGIIIALFGYQYFKSLLADPHLVPYILCI